VGAADRRCGLVGIQRCGGAEGPSSTSSQHPLLTSSFASSGLPAPTCFDDPIAGSRGGQGRTGEGESSSTQQVARV
jgi:hypothetical protein